MNEHDSVWWSPDTAVLRRRLRQRPRRDAVQQDRPLDVVLAATAAVVSNAPADADSAVRMQAWRSCRFT